MVRHWDLPCSCLNHFLEKVIKQVEVTEDSRSINSFIMFANYTFTKSIHNFHLPELFPFFPFFGIITVCWKDWLSTSLKKSCSLRSGELGDWGPWWLSKSAWSRMKRYMKLTRICIEFKQTLAQHKNLSQKHLKILSLTWVPYCCKAFVANVAIFSLYIAATRLCKWKIRIQMHLNQGSASFLFKYCRFEFAAQCGHLKD